jgi:hypothetical protein
MSAAQIPLQISLQISLIVIGIGSPTLSPAWRKAMAAERQQKRR